MDIEEEGSNFYEIVKKEEISTQSDTYPCQPKLEVIQLEPMKRITHEEESEEDEKQSQKRMKQKQLLKRRVCNKLMKYNNKDEIEINRQKYIHIIPNLNIPPPVGDYFVFGDIILEGDYKQDPYNMDKTFSWAYFKRSNSVTYLKDIKCIEVQMSNKIFICL